MQTEQPQCPCGCGEAARIYPNGAARHRKGHHRRAHPLPVAAFQCGIYEIRNRKSGGVYVGSSTKINHRWCTHLMQLVNGNHGCTELQAAWNQDGEEAFEFVTVEEVDSWQLSDLTEAEHRVWKRRMSEPARIVYNQRPIGVDIERREGNELRAFLERHGMAREAFAREAGVSWITVQRWCTTDAKPSQLAERSAREAMRKHDGRARK